MQAIDQQTVEHKVALLLANISTTADKIRSGQWNIFYDKEVDELVWGDPNAKPSDSSILFPVDDYFTVSVNKETVTIEYFNVQSFHSVYSKLNPELKPFADRLAKQKNGINWAELGTELSGAMERMLGKIASEKDFALSAT